MAANQYRRLIAYLRNPTNPAFAESETRELQTAARAHGMGLLIFDASRSTEIDTAFAELAQQRVDALQVSSDGFLLTHPDQIVALAAHYAIPAVYAWPQYPAVGGLMSYGTNIRDAWRQAGIYTGRILKGEKPANLPVQQATKIELVINLKTAKTLGLAVPLSLLGYIHTSSRRRAAGRMSKRILVVEDQPDNRQIIRDMLAPTDYEITEAENGEEALAAIAKQRPDLILMDIQLPIMDGYTATSRIKADPALTSIPVIAVTSYALSGEEKKARAAGCDDYVPKPFSPRQLLAKIRQYLP
jgi:two-component system, cell cycle response regulator DivK